jgi:erythromycin esterase-like protein
MNHIKIYISLILILFKSNITIAQNDFDALNNIILSKIPKETNIIGLGDPTHQESTVTKYRVELIKRLIEQKEFKIIALEGNIYELYKAQQKFNQSNDISYLENAMYSQLNIAEMEELYQYVYNKNQKGDSIIITGFDPTFSGNTFVQNLKEELRKIDFLNKEQKQDFINNLEKATITNLKALFRNNKIVRSKIVHYSKLLLNEFKPKTESDYFFEQALRNIVFLYGSEEGESSDNMRDIGMSNNITFLNKLYNNKKIILLGSSTHLLKNPKKVNSFFFQDNRKTFGEQLSKNKQTNYYFLAYSAISGKKSNTFNKPKQLPVLVENSIEYKNKDVNTSVFLYKSNSNEETTNSRFLGHNFLEINIWKVMDGLVLIQNIAPAKIKKL